MFYDLQKQVFGDMQIGEVQMDSQTVQSKYSLESYVKMRDSTGRNWRINREK